MQTDRQETKLTGGIKTNILTSLLCFTTNIIYLALIRNRNITKIYIYRHAYFCTFVKLFFATISKQFKDLEIKYHM